MIARLIVASILIAHALAAQKDRDIQTRLEEARQAKAHGSPKKALDVYEALLPLLRHGADRTLLARVLIETGQTAAALGNYARAIERAAEAGEIYRQAGDGKGESAAFNDAGNAATYQGDYASALRAFERSLALADAARDTDSAAVRLCNIGSIYFFQGRYFDALHSYEGALRKAGEPTGAASKGRQLALANLAILYEQLGQNEKALEYYQSAEAGAAALKTNEYAQLLSNIGTLYRRMGDPVKALETYGRARQVFRRDQHADAEVHILENIGIVLALDYHQLEPALAAFTDALKLAESMANRRQTVLAQLYRGEALYRLERYEESRAAYGKALALAREIGATEEQWTAQYGLGRIYQHDGKREAAREAFQQATAIIENVRSSLGLSSLKSDFLANKRNVYDSLIAAVLDAPQTDREQIFELFEQARSRNLQDALRRTMPKASIGSIQGRLDRGSMLVEYWSGKDEIAALWITRDGSGVARKRVSAAERESVARLAEALAGDGTRDWRGEAEPIGRMLFADIPMETGVRHLFIVPDGPLYSLPFEVVPPQGAGPILVERCAVSYLPAAALLLRGLESRTELLPWRRQLVGFGDPLVEARAGLPTDQAWSRLPDSARELRSIAGALPGRAELHLGADDLKRHLTSDAAAAPVLHFSTHAAVDTIDPNRSRILFTAERGNAGSKYLFWQEVQRLRLARAELVTLSACETEGGKLVPGEGIQSFSRAFLAAGAGATVTALWRVADAPTAEFMRIFYRGLARGASKAEALRAAKLEFLRSGSQLSQPRFWAAFVLNGDGQAPLSKVIRWSWIAAGAVLVLAAITGIRRVSGRRRATPAAVRH